MLSAARSCRACGRPPRQRAALHAAALHAAAAVARAPAPIAAPPPAAPRPAPLDPATHFYASRVVEQYAKREPSRVTLRQLVTFGRHLDQQRLIRSANYLREELPVRLAHRLFDFQRALPFVAVTNEHLQRVYALYWDAFSIFRAVPPVETLEDNDRFCALLRSTLRQHRSVIPRLALGLLECHARGALSAATVDSFMSEMLRSRIGRRVLAQQHLALTDALRNPDRAPVSPDRPVIGIVSTQASGEQAVRRAASIAESLLMHSFPGLPFAPAVHVTVRSWDGAADVRFPAIEDHVLYILLELLKNAMAATVRQCYDPATRTFSAAALSSRPVSVTIAAGPEDVIFRVSDQGGGVPKSVQPALFSFARRSSPDACIEPVDPDRVHDGQIEALPTTGESQLRALAETPYLTATVEEQLTVPSTSAPTTSGRRPTFWTPEPSPPPPTPEAPFEWSTDQARALPSAPMRHLGLGAPLARVFAEYWAGSLDVIVLDGHGTDAYLRLPRRGTVAEVVRPPITVDAR